MPITIQLLKVGLNSEAMLPMRPLLFVMCKKTKIYFVVLLVQKVQKKSLGTIFSVKTVTSLAAADLRSLQL